MGIAEEVGQVGAVGVVGNVEEAREAGLAARWVPVLPCFRRSEAIVKQRHMRGQRLTPQQLGTFRQLPAACLAP